MHEGYCEKLFKKTFPTLSSHTNPVVDGTVLEDERNDESCSAYTNPVVDGTVLEDEPHV